MINTLPHLLYHQGLRFGETTAQLSKDEKGIFQPTSYNELLNQTLNFAGGLLSLGCKKGDHIGHIADDRQEWQVVSIGIMSIGASDIPRGTDVTKQELSYILNFTECNTVSVENPFVLEKLCSVIEEIPTLKHIILIDDKNQSLEKYELKNIQLHRYSSILKKGAEWRKNNPSLIEKMILDGKSDETATIIFTSGTTGTPKGVELSHNNFLCQLQPISERLDFHKGDRTLCILPVWHVYQRLLELYVFYFAGTLCYSKPVSSILLNDFLKVRPQMMPCVPRVWESLYQAISKKIKKESKLTWILFNLLSSISCQSLFLMDSIKNRKKSFKKIGSIKLMMRKLLYIPYGILFPFRVLGKKLFFNNLKELVGGQFIAGISGGGGFPLKLDRFFNSIGIKVVEGYGLTETAPIVALRDRFNSVIGTIGKPLPYNSVKILNDKKEQVIFGQKGILFVKGDNVMKGYYKQKELTEKVLDEDGWFNTGDIAIQTYTGELVIRGRQKDTIVLRSGENVEPFPIEAKLSESPYITQAVIVGQDENSLGALIIPNIDAIKNIAIQRQIKNSDNVTKLLNSDFTKELIMRELEKLICSKNGFKNYERVSQFTFLEKFENPSEELSAKGEIIRYKIYQNYKHLISKMYIKESKKQRLSEIIQNLLEN